MKKINLDNTTKKNYYDLGYRILISALVGMIPVILISQITSVVDCNEVTDIEKREECFSRSESIKDPMKYVSYGMGIVMFVVSFKGVLWEWKRNQERSQDRSPLKINYLKTEERIIDSNYQKDKAEQEAIRKKYEQMEDLK